MSKWTGTKPKEEIPSRVKGEDGYYYLTDDRGNATDKIDADYYKDQPGFKAFMDKSGIKSFNSVNDIKELEKFQKTFTDADLAQLQKESREPIYKSLQVGDSDNYGLTDDQVAKANEWLGKKGQKNNGDLKMKHIKKLHGKGLFEGTSFDQVLNYAKDLHIKGDVNFGEKMLDKIEGNVGKYGDMGTDFLKSGEKSLNDIMKEAVGDEGWDNMYKGGNFEKAKDALEDAFKSGQFDPRQPSDEELFKRFEVPEAAQKAMDKFDNKYGDRIGKNSGKLLRDKDGNKIKINPPTYKNAGEDKIKAARLKMNAFQSEGGFSPKNVNANRSKQLKSKGKSIISGLGI